ncbi:hypothetical protein CRN51_18490 [Vibrio vulnificus]|nr:hypothetical protein CRN51_18490 [Vibrio vulnificus]
MVYRSILDLQTALKAPFLCLSERRQIASKEKPRGLAPIGVMVLLAAIQLLKCSLHQILDSMLNPSA